MNLKSKIVIIVLAGIGAIAIICAAFAAANTIPEKAYTSYLASAGKYLEDGEYDKAIIAFETALSLKDDIEEAYEGLAYAYIAKGDTQTAYLWLKKGINRTNSNRLIHLLDINFAEIMDAENNDKGHTVPKINDSLMNFISTARFGDYAKYYSVNKLTPSENRYFYEVVGINCTLVFDNSGSVNKINKSTGLPYNEILPDNIKITSIKFLFDGTDKLTVDELSAIEGVSQISRDDGIIKFTYADCDVTVTTNTEGNIDSNSNISVTVLTEQVKEEREVSEGNIKVRGSICDAVEGTKVGQVKITIEDKSSSGNAIEVKTNNSGEYSAELEGGKTYRIKIEKEGYITEESEFYVPANANVVNPNFTISPETEAGEIRIVLTWGSLPYDLDSYLEGTTSTGSHVDINYRHMRAADAELDVDDMDGNGPETVTLKDSMGSYEFYVLDYTQSGMMSDSGAQVKVYKNNSLVETVNICPGCENGWAVLKIEQGKIIVINSPR